GRRRGADAGAGRGDGLTRPAPSGKQNMALRAAGGLFFRTAAPPRNVHAPLPTSDRRPARRWARHPTEVHMHEGVESMGKVARRLGGGVLLALLTFSLTSWGAVTVF